MASVTKYNQGKSLTNLSSDVKLFHVECYQKGNKEKKTQVCSSEIYLFS